MDNPLDKISVIVDESFRSKIQEILEDATFKHNIKIVSLNIIQFLDKNSSLTDDVANMLTDKEYKRLINCAVEKNGFDFRVELENGFQSLAKQYELPDDLRNTCFRMLWQSISNYLMKNEPEFFQRYLIDKTASTVDENNKILKEIADKVDKTNADKTNNVSIVFNQIFQKNENTILNIEENNFIANDLLCVAADTTGFDGSISLSTRTDEGIYDDSMYRSLRKEFVGDILDAMSDSSHPGIVIWGEGGLGKTSTAIWLHNHFSADKKYKNVIWIEYNESIDDSLLGAANGLDRLRRTREEQLILLRDYLQSSKLPRTLIVLDDVSDAEFESPSGFITLETLRKCKNLDVIITTRTSEGTDDSESNIKKVFNWKRIHPLDEDQAVILFKYYYSQAFEPNTDDESTIKSIVNYVFFNPLCIELIAKAAKQIIKDDDITLSEFWKRVIGNDETNHLAISLPKVEIETNYSKSERLTSSILQNVYNLSKLSDSDQMVLWDFAILPNIYIKKNEIENIIGCSKDDVERLFNRGWLKSLPGKGYQMHDIVKTMIWIKHLENPLLSGSKPDDYEDFTYSYSHNTNGFAPEGTFKNIFQNEDCEMMFSENETYESESMKIQIFKACRDRVKIPDKNIVNFLSVLARHTFFGLGNKTEAEVLYKDAIEYVDWYSTTDVMAVYYNYAYLLSSMGSNRFSEAVDLMESARIHMLDWQATWKDFLPLPENASPYEQICEIIYFESLLALGESGKKFGGISSDRQYICHFYYISDYAHYAKILDHLGYILTIIGTDKCVLAAAYLHIALRIREALLELSICAYLAKKDNKPQHSSFEEQIDNLVQEYLTGQGQETRKRIAEKIDRQNRSKEFQEFFVSWDNCDIIPDVQDVATTKDNLGYLLSHGKKDCWGQAEKLLTEALELRRKLEEIEKGKHGSELSWTLSNLAEVKVKMGGKENLQSAEGFYREAIEIRKELCKKTCGKYRDNLAWSYIGLARCYEAMKNTDEMNNYLQSALNLYEGLAKENADFSDDASVVKKMIEKQTVSGIIGNQTHIRFVE